MEEGLFCVDFYIIIYHAERRFSNARVRVCEKKWRKNGKIAGNGLPGDLRLCLELKILHKDKKGWEGLSATFSGK